MELENPKLVAPRSSARLGILVLFFRAEAMGIHPAGDGPVFETLPKGFRDDRSVGLRRSRVCKR